jgi:hypothetical protein
MSLRILDDLSPHARLVTAVFPFVLAMLLRLLFGRNRLVAVLVFLSTAWFALNICLTPYSAGMRQDLMELRSALR